MRTFKLYELITNQIPRGAMIAIEFATRYTYIFRYNGVMMKEDSHSIYSLGVDKLKVIKSYKQNGIMMRKTMGNSRLFVLLSKSKYIKTNIRFATKEEINIYNEIHKTI